MTSITWASPRYVQELATILGPQNPTQRSCDMLCNIIVTSLQGTSLLYQVYARTERKEIDKQNIFVTISMTHNSAYCLDIMIKLLVNSIEVRQNAC